MAKYALKAGAEIEVVTPGELQATLSQHEAWREIARMHGIKHMRLPENLSGKAASSALALSVANGQPAVGPREGYIWVARRLVVNGLTSGASPDVVNLYHDSTTGQPLWQFNGNNFGYTFGKLEITLNGGETFALASVGTFNATGTITLSGEVVEVPAELKGKLA